MRRYLIWGLVFLSALFVTDRLLGYVLGEISSQSSFRFSRLYRGGADADILILGNSRVVNSFSQPDLEKELGKKVFNMSYNGLRIDIARVLLDDYLALNRKPSTIIIEASMLTRAYPELAKELKPYVTSENGIGTILKELYPDIYRYSMVSHVFRYNSEIFLRSLYYLTRDDQRWINEGVISSEHERELEGFQGAVFDVDSALLRDLVAIEQRCLSESIELKVILAPYLPAYAQKIRNLDEWKQAIDRSLSNGTVMDCSRCVEGSESFADWVHLNRSGSKVLLDTLLKANYFEL